MTTTRKHSTEEQLVMLASCLAESGSTPEDMRWEALMGSLCRSIMLGRHPEAAGPLLDRVRAEKPDAVFQELANAFETAAECDVLEDGTQTMLLVVPVLYWSAHRQLECVKLGQAHTRAIRKSLSAILTEGAAIHVLPWLMSVDNLPHDVWDVCRMHRELRAGRTSTAWLKDLAAREVQQALTDCRYVLATVAVPADSPFYAYQADADAAFAKAALMKAASDGIAAALRPLLFGCNYSVRQPLPYYSALKDSDLSLRPFSLGATMKFLCTSYGLKPEEILATIAEFSVRMDGREDCELRIGLTGVRNSGRVLEGLVWPLYEDSAEDSITAIMRELTAQGCKAIGVLDQSFPADVTEADGAMLFPMPNGQCGPAEIPPEDEVPEIIEPHQIN